MCWVDPLWVVQLPPTVQSPYVLLIDGLELGSVYIGVNVSICGCLSTLAAELGSNLGWMDGPHPTPRAEQF